MSRRWVALIGPEIEENLSLRYLASSLERAGFASEIFAYNDGSELASLARRLAQEETPPLLVGISLAFQWRGADSLGLAVALRQAGYRGHVTVGGHFATFTALEVLRDFPEVDSVCRQEAEETVVELAKAVDAGAAWSGLDGLAARDASGTPVLNPVRHPPELASLPWPDRRGAPAQSFGHPIAPLVSTRGCYANCAFCCIAAWHELALPGKRYRERPLEDVADEMAAEHFGRGVQIYVFHDDNFFLPSGVKNAERIARLADLLEARGVREFATVVKARPTDVQPAAFDALVRRLNCIRCYIGIETDADQGLKTLRRWAQPKHNQAAMELVEQLGLYVCFNVLLFDPDTTVESLETNLDFMQRWAQYSFNFGRTELYAGTPLLERMQREGRARGDWLQWDYSMADEQVERIFQLSTRAFFDRNFQTDAIANNLMLTCFDVEVARRFHPQRWREEWRSEIRRLTARLGRDSVAGMREVISRVKANEPRRGDAAFCAELAGRLREVEHEVREGSFELARDLRSVLQQGTPLTFCPDRAQTPLQRAREEARP